MMRSRLPVDVQFEALAQLVRLFRDRWRRAFNLGGAARGRQVRRKGDLGESTGRNWIVVLLAQTGKVNH